MSVMLVSTEPLGLRIDRQMYRIEAIVFAALHQTCNVEICEATFCFNINNEIQLHNCFGCCTIVMY